MTFWQTIRAFFCGLPKAETIDELRDRDYTPEKIRDYAKAHFRYRADTSSNEEWRNPVDAFNCLQNDGDDCEGFAIVYWYCLSKNYLCHLVGVWTYMDGHAICVYQDGDRWRYLDNHFHAGFDFKTIKDICYDVYAKPARAYFQIWNGKRVIKGEDISL